MKNSIKVIVLLISLLSITGCGNNLKDNSKKSTPEVDLCNKLDNSINKYNNNEISFNDFASEVENISSSFCNENSDNNICTQIKMIKEQNNYDYSLEDCSSKPDSLKSLCESTNNVKRDMISKKEKTEKAHVSELNYQCELAKE